MVSIRQKLAVDCGSYKTTISDTDGKIKLSELSLIYQVNGDLSAIGSTVPLIHGKGDPVAPILDYEIGGKYFTQKMLSLFLQKAAGKIYGVFRPKLDVLFALPIGDDADRMKHIVCSLLVENISFIEQPLAAAFGVGLDSSLKQGNMIVDVGHKTTDIAVLSGGEIVSSSSIPIAGKMFNEDIKRFLEKHCNLCVGEVTSQRIKHEVGAAIQNLSQEEIPVDYYVRGSNITRTDWSEANLSFNQVASCLDTSLTKIEAKIKEVLNQLPSELIGDISRNGIWLIGGSARLRGIAKRFSENLGISCFIPNDPELVITRGTARAFGMFKL